MYDKEMTLVLEATSIIMRGHNGMLSDEDWDSYNRIMDEIKGVPKKPLSKKSQELLKIYEDYKNKYLGTYIDGSIDSYYRDAIEREKVTKTELIKKLRRIREARRNAPW